MRQEVRREVRPEMGPFWESRGTFWPAHFKRWALRKHRFLLGQKQHGHDKVIIICIKILSNRSSKAEVEDEVVNEVEEVMFFGLFGRPGSPKSPTFTPRGQICMPK